MSTVVKSKRGTRKLYRFSTPYSQTATNSRDKFSDVYVQNSEDGYFLGACDPPVENVKEQDTTAVSVQLSNVAKDKTKLVKGYNESNKRTCSSVAVVVDNHGIAIHERDSSFSVQKSMHSAKRDVAADKRMVLLRVLNTIFKMKNELTIIRERRQKLAEKQREMQSVEEE